VHFAPGYGYVDPTKVTPNQPFDRVHRPAFVNDMALIVLKDALHDIVPLELYRTEVQSSSVSLVHASYSADRRYMLSGHFGCHLVAPDQNLWFTDCDTHVASSGGPMFIQEGESLKLAAIMVGVVSGSVSIAVPLSNWSDAANTRNCP
jgi:hypothetical protein